MQWLTQAGHEPVDCGPSSYVPDDDYPVYVMRAASATIGEPGSLGREYSIDEAVGFAKVFVETAFSGEPRHVRRLTMIADYEQTGELPAEPASS